MCTVSVVATGAGFRIACNRDERLTRPRAEPPAVRATRPALSAWPLDPLSGGTWIGANDAGLAACVLNRTPRGCPVHPAPQSRGTIVPSILATASLPAALTAAARLSAARFEPFTLVVLQAGLVAVMTNVGERMTIRVAGLSKPTLFTSSSLGDHVVIPPRHSLFARMVSNSSDPLDAQAAFHDHQWAAHPEISVRMKRPDAATVSQTFVDVTGDAVHLRYRAVHD